MSNENHYLWNETYRPRKIADCILPKALKETFQAMVDKGDVPNITLSGPAGVGKTTVARALCEELDFDYIIINGSDEGRLIDTLRTKIKNFASAVSFTGSRKVVILDEADYLSIDSVQPALRNFIESFSGSCGFILTCNFQNKLMDALVSRAPIIDFRIPPDAKPNMELQIYKRVKKILDDKGITYDQKALVLIIKKNFPDFRKILNLLQRYAVSGTIDAGILTQVGGVQVAELIALLKSNSYKEIREWVGSQTVDMSVLCKALYENMKEELTNTGHAQLVLHLAKYQYQHGFVADPEVNVCAMLVEIMTDVTWA